MHPHFRTLCCSILFGVLNWQHDATAKEDGGEARASQ